MEKRPRHINDNNDKILFRQLEKLVKKRLDRLPDSRLFMLKMKVFLWPLLYFGIYALALTQLHNIPLFIALYALMGVVLVVIFVELIHELCHSNIFENQQYNKWAYYLFDLLGANSYIWRQRHLKFHHRFPNVNEWDADVEQKGPLMIFESENLKPYYRFQHWYVFIMYPLFVLNWIFIRDFKDYFSRNRVIRKLVKIPRMEYVKLFFFKVFYMIMMIFVPFILGMDFLIALSALIVLAITASVLAMFILLTPHVNSKNAFPKPDLSGNIPISWFRHQFLATNDIDASNWFVRNVMGNFNFHLAHHLFPGVSSVYAPEVSKVIQDFSLLHGLPYKCISIWESLRRHYQLIRENARKAELKMQHTVK